MPKIDYKKELKNLYGPSSKEPALADVPEMTYLMIDGMGNPGTSKEYAESIEAIYTVSYTLKFMAKKSLEIDYVVPPLEGLWWSDDMTDFAMGNKDSWRWTSMIMLPSFVAAELYEKSLEAARKKKNLPAIDKIRIEKYDEGLCVQIMHVGPYSAEGPTIERLHNYSAENGFVLRGKHHEIYLSDPRKAAPEKMKTVIRQPVSKA